VGSLSGCQSAYGNRFMNVLRPSARSVTRIHTHTHTHTHTQSEQGAGIRTTPLAYKSSLNGGCVVGGVEEARGGAGGGGMLSSDLPPISEQEGRLSGESAGNTSTSSNGSNDSVNRSGNRSGLCACARVRACACVLACLHAHRLAPCVTWRRCQCVSIRTRD